jgi:hypothetical protein
VLTDEHAARIESLLTRAAAASGGNPGLLALLSRTAREPDNFAAAEAAIEAVERYSSGDERPTEGDLGQFFVQLALDNYRTALTEDETAQMRAALALKGFAVPWQVMEAAGSAAGVDRPTQAIERLLGLGCMDAFHVPGHAARDPVPECAVNALAKPLYEALSEPEYRHLARAVAEPLYAAWADNGTLAADERAPLLFALALAAETSIQIVNASALAASFYHAHIRHDAETALSIAEVALSLVDRQQGAPDLHVIRIGVECATLLGKVDEANGLLARGLASPGEDERALAMLHGTLADRLVQGGELDEALRIRREEQLPVYERLGDVRSRAVTMGKVADILAARGELDEALRIRREEEP